MARTAIGWNRNKRPEHDDCGWKPSLPIPSRHLGLNRWPFSSAALDQGLLCLSMDLPSNFSIIVLNKISNFGLFPDSQTVWVATVQMSNCEGYSRRTWCSLSDCSCSTVCRNEPCRLEGAYKSEITIDRLSIRPQVDHAFAAGGKARNSVIKQLIWRYLF